MLRGTTLFTLTFSLTSLLLTSCSSGPKGPEPGTPAFYWQGAKETFAAKDYMKTLDNLDRAARNAELAPQATAWALIIDAGLIRGYSDLADEFEMGARVNRNNPGAFRKQVSDYRRTARPLTLQLAERFLAFKKGTDAQVALAFPFPAGTASESPLQDKIAKGILPQASELEDTQHAAISRGMVLAATEASGAGNDTTKAQELFKAGDLKVPRATFTQAVGKALFNAAELFGPKKLDEPDRARMFAENAKEALKGAPDSKEMKAINEKIEKILKDTKKPA